MNLSVMNGFMRRSWQMELRSIEAVLRHLWVTLMLLLEFMFMYWAHYMLYWSSILKNPLSFSVGCTG